MPFTLTLPKLSPQWKRDDRQMAQKSAIMLKLVISSRSGYR